MLKLLATAMILSLAAPCFSEERSKSVIIEEVLAEHPGLAHVGYGFGQLLAGQPELAVYEFQTALDGVEPVGEYEKVIIAFTSFGQIAAYDILGLRDECKQAVGTLFLMVMNEVDDEDEEDSDDSEVLDGFDDISPLFAEDTETAIKMLREIAASAPSPDVRKLLFTMVAFLEADDDDDNE